MIALTHHPKVLQVDTCRAYHAGNNLFVEVDIVMDRETPLWESHDIGESIQIKLENGYNCTFRWSFIRKIWTRR